MQALMNLPNNVEDLRNLYDYIESHIRGLSSLAVTQESYGALLVPMVLGKLPIEIKRNMAEA